MTSDPLYYPESFEDWRIDVSSNEVECAVTVIHIPSGITETCSDMKSLVLNRREAFRRAEARIAGPEGLITA